MTTTANLGLTKPTVGADSDTWGGELNTDLDIIDTLATIVQIDLNGGDQGSLSTNAFNKILFTHATTDSPTWFDSTNHRVTPTVACTLRFALHYGIDGAALARSGLPAIYKNGASVGYGTEVVLSSGAMTQARGYAEAIVSFNGSTDYGEGWLFVPTGASAIRGAIIDTRLMVTRIK